MIPEGERARAALGAGLLASVAFVAYANVLDAPFLFDDRPAIVENARIRRAWPPWAALRTPRDTPVAGRPVVNLTLAWNHALGGLEVRGYHLLNLAVHVGCGLVLFGLVRRTLRTRASLRDGATGLALATSALWIAHPLTSECIAYVTQRTESIMALFYLLTLYAVARTAGARGPAARRGWGAAAVAACALGMASKETMVTAPIVALLYDAAYHAGSPREALRRRPVLYAGLAGCWLVLAAVAGAGARAGSVGSSLGVTPIGYLANQALVVPAYLKRIVWPHPLVLDYGWPRPLGPADVIPQLVLLGALAAAIVVLAWRRPALGFPALAGMLVLAPTSTFVPIVTEIGAERRMYLPLAGILVLAVLGGRALLSRTHLPPRAVRAVGMGTVAVSVALLVAVTRSRNEDYRSQEAIWRTVVEAVPRNPRGLLNLGEALRVQGRTGEAESLFRQALELYPGYARAEAHLGLLALERGDTQAAEAHLRRSLEIDPRHGDVRTNLGELLARTGRAREALAQWREALAGNPELAYAANNLAWTLATHPDAGLRDGDAAVRWAEHGAELTAYSDAHLLDTLGAAYAEAGRWDAARRAASQALALAEAQGETGMADEIRARAALYAQHRPYRAGPRAR